MTDANLRQYDWLSNFKGLKSKESDKISSQKKKEAWEKFNKAFPRADLSKFTVEVVFYSKTKVEATVYFKAGDGLQQSVFGSNRKFWSNEMKKALGILSSGGFPEELQEATIPSLPVPALDYEENPPSLKKIYSGGTKIFVKPSIYFTANFRDIFDKTTLKHVTAKESKEWLSGPKMRYWPQQLNFAVWCATVGSGVSRDIFDKTFSSLGMPENVYGFYQFYVYFTTRRILFEMGGISSISSLPGDPNFDPLKCDSL